MCSEYAPEISMHSKHPLHTYARWVSTFVWRFLILQTHRTTKIEWMKSALTNGPGFCIHKTIRTQYINCIWVKHKVNAIERIIVNLIQFAYKTFNCLTSYCDKTLSHLFGIYQKVDTLFVLIFPVPYLYCHFDNSSETMRRLSTFLVQFGAKLLN